MRTRNSPLLVVSVALALSVTACAGADDGDTAAEPGDTAAEPGDTAAEAGDTPGDSDEAGGEADVAVADTDLGEVLVDGDGMTLYLFTPDPEGESTCEDDCAAAWPPLVVDGEPTPGEGVDPELLGTLERSDGSTQVSYAGAPLYTWASDQEPGDVTGQGVGDVWYVVGADGAPITDDAQPDDATATDGDDGEIGY